MKLIKRTASHAIYQRRDGRYAVRSTRQQAINGEDKVKILLAEGLLVAPATKTVEPESTAAESTAAESTAAESTAAESTAAESEAGDNAEAGDAEQAENTAE